jgi:DNA-directed RNA polymerase subunit RPC12/RpoP
MLMHLKGGSQMERSCLKCATELAPSWSFCPHCGAAIAAEPGHKPLPAEHEKAPSQGPFAGLLFGVLVVPILIVVGTMLCLTGLGAIAGVPMILAAVLAPLLGPMIGFGALRGKCPWCGVQVSSINGSKSFYCHACSKGVEVKNREFLKAG